MSENELLAAVLDLARVYGWKTYHARPAMTAKGYRTPVQGDGKGFPDLLMVKGDKVVIAELKAEKGKTTPEQDAWLAALYYHCDNEPMVWRPEQWHDGTILKTLSEIDA